MSSSERPDNETLAELLNEFADRLEAKGIDYKPAAYRRAAENVVDYPGAVAALATDGTKAVKDIDRVGDAIAAKLVEYVETGAIEELEALRSELPADIETLTAVEGVGPKTVARLYQELDVQTLTDLERVAQEGKIRELRGFGKKSEQNILDNIAFARESQQRELLGDARPVADRLIQRLQAHDAVNKCEVAGSIRRWKPTIGDIDVLVGTDHPEQVVEAFIAAGDETIEAGTSKASIRLAGVQADLRVVAPTEYGSALQYFTGSKEHNVKLRNYALERDISLNEYGAFDLSEANEDSTADQRPGPRIAGATEASMYEVLGLTWIPPELRQGDGEIKAAATGDLPTLVTVDDIRGDIHVHTNWSDGTASIETMVTAASEFGHEYLAITDHANGPGIVGDMGLSPAELRDQQDRIREIDAQSDIDVLSGVETNITAEGEISTPDDVLAELDIVVASAHSGLSGDGTARLAQAINHPQVDVLGHPSGRRINQRSGLEFDPRELGATAADAGTALEVNSSPGRLDLWGEAVKAAIDAGAEIVINTDAHRARTLRHLRYGVYTARRGWAEPHQIRNTKPVATLSENKA